MRIGLFGGTFDPIHFGHLNLALTLAEKHHLDQVVFCPARLSPFKLESPPVASLDHRKAMVALAIQDIPGFSVWESMPEREGASYTIDLIKDFLASHTMPGRADQLFLILGKDALDHFDRWKEVEEIVRLAPPLTGVRPGITPRVPSSCSQKILEGMTPVPLMEISGTEIRKRLSEKKICYHWVPAIVLDYIYTNNLYSLR